MRLNSDEVTVRIHEVIDDTDREIAVIATILRALDRLQDPREVERVLNYAIDYGRTTLTRRLGGGEGIEK